MPPCNSESPDRVISLLKETLEIKNKYISLLESEIGRLKEENAILKNIQKEEFRPKLNIVWVNKEN